MESVEALFGMRGGAFSGDWGDPFADGSAVTNMELKSLIHRQRFGSATRLLSVVAAPQASTERTWWLWAK